MNTPVTKQQLQTQKENLSGVSGILFKNSYENRAKRRINDKTGILNNRKETRGRKSPHRVLERMAYFSLSIHAKINKL